MNSSELVEGLYNSPVELKTHRYADAWHFSQDKLHAKTPYQGKCDQNDFNAIIE